MAILTGAVALAVGVAVRAISRDIDAKYQRA
jgi:hypothetical protein